MRYLRPVAESYTDSLVDYLQQVPEVKTVVVTVHSQFDLSRRRQTERLLRAMDNSCFSLLAYPTGRLLQEREAYYIDILVTA